VRYGSAGLVSGTAKNWKDIMVTVKLYDEWEFRVLRNGEVESRNVKKKLDWAIRNADSIGFLADQLYFIGQAMLQIAALFPAGRQEIPKSAEVALPITQDAQQAV
jgi:hypothetical protein